MRVEITDFEQFMAELAEEAKAGRVADKLVRARVDRVPEQEEGLSFTVGFWATAVVKGEDADWILEFLGTGRDDGDDAGSEWAAEAKQRLAAACERDGLTLRPGKIEQY